MADFRAGVVGDEGGAAEVVAVQVRKRKSSPTRVASRWPVAVEGLVGWSR